jgi:uncharacterized protein YoxC
MRLLVFTLTFVMITSYIFPAWSQENELVMNKVNQQLQALHIQINEINRQNRQILENQAKILQELQVVKVRIRRS